MCESRHALLATNCVEQLATHHSQHAAHSQWPAQIASTQSAPRQGTCLRLQGDAGVLLVKVAPLASLLGSSAAQHVHSGKEQSHGPAQAGTTHC